MKSAVKLIMYVIGTLPGQIVGALVGMLLKFSFLRPGAIFKLKLRGFKPENRMKDIMSLIIRVTMGIATKVMLKLLYSK